MHYIFKSLISFYTSKIRRSPYCIPENLSFYITKFISPPQPPNPTPSLFPPPPPRLSALARSFNTRSVHTTLDESSRTPLSQVCQVRAKSHADQVSSVLSLAYPKISSDDRYGHFWGCIFYKHGIFSPSYRLKMKIAPERMFDIYNMCVLDQLYAVNLCSFLGMCHHVL